MSVLHAMLAVAFKQNALSVLREEQHKRWELGSQKNKNNAGRRKQSDSTVQCVNHRSKDVTFGGRV